MNQDMLLGRWKQIRGDVKSWWGRLTDDDLDRIHGSAEKLAGLLQERYGYTWKRTQEEIADFLEIMESKLERQPER